MARWGDGFTTGLLLKVQHLLLAWALKNKCWKVADSATELVLLTIEVVNFASISRHFS